MTEFQYYSVSAFILVAISVFRLFIDTQLLRIDFHCQHMRKPRSRDMDSWQKGGGGCMGGIRRVGWQRGVRCSWKPFKNAYNAYARDRELGERWQGNWRKLRAQGAGVQQFSCGEAALYSTFFQEFIRFCWPVTAWICILLTLVIPRLLLIANSCLPFVVLSEMIWPLPNKFDKNIHVHFREDYHKFVLSNDLM